MTTGGLPGSASSPPISGAVTAVGFTSGEPAGVDSEVDPRPLGGRWAPSPVWAGSRRDSAAPEGGGSRGRHP